MLKRLKVGAKPVFQFRMFERVLDRRLQIAEFIAAIVAPAGELVGINRLLTKQIGYAVGELYFAAGTGAHLFRGNRK